MIKLAIIILNYRTPGLVLDCLRSFEHEIQVGRDCVVVVDNHSADSSPQIIQAGIDQAQWSWVTLVHSAVNAGFSAGNNVGIQAISAEAYFLINSDTIARVGILDRLHAALADYPHAGIISPRLEWPDGRGQISCFRNISPLSELMAAAQTGPIDKLLHKYTVAIPLTDKPLTPAWTSFAAVLLRHKLIEQVGLMDEGFFMYFEDVDYCRRTRAAGWQIQHVPTAKMVHLRGGSSDVKSATLARKRRPPYFYAARSHYFRKFYGGASGVVLANLAWIFGRTISLLRELLGSKAPHTCAHEARDIWIAWRGNKEANS